jgi:peptide-methionine (R)-S-oxide reductase
MQRRNFLTRVSTVIAGLVGTAAATRTLNGQAQTAVKTPASAVAAVGEAEIDVTPVKADKIVKLTLSDDEWKKRLSPAAYRVLRKEGTEPSGSSALNGEKRKGTFVCAGCDLPVFTSEMKYESGTGWPSFFDTIPAAFNTSTDYKLIYPRTEYHCARCGGHHGHVFSDGPKPTGKRWCNNGVSLKFVAAKV